MLEQRGRHSLILSLASLSWRAGHRRGREEGGERRKPVLVHGKSVPLDADDKTDVPFTDMRLSKSIASPDPHEQSRDTLASHEQEQLSLGFQGGFDQLVQKEQL